MQEQPQQLIGALLRIPWEIARQRLLDALHAAGFTDLYVAHMAVLLYPGPHGKRPSDLAAQRGMTRQAVNYLLGQIEELGYIERRDNPDDRRSKLVALTPRGRKVVVVMRGAMVELEQEWSEQLGPLRFAQLKAMLAELATKPDR